MKKTYGDPSMSWILDEARRSGVQNAGDLWRLVHSHDPKLKFEEFRHQLNELISRGLLETSSPQLIDFQNYLKSWTFGFRIWIFAIGTLLALSIVNLVPSDFPLVAARWAAGTFLAMFAPGYSLTWALFPTRGHLSRLSRLALTIVTSLFLVPAVALVLNFTAFGIRPEPISWVLAAITLGLLFFGAHREFLAERKTD